MKCFLLLYINIYESASTRHTYVSKQYLWVSLQQFAMEKEKESHVYAHKLIQTEWVLLNYSFFYVFYGSSL